jgi:hypothetical protein
MPRFLRSLRAWPRVIGLIAGIILAAAWLLSAYITAYTACPWFAVGLRCGRVTLAWAPGPRAPSWRFDAYRNSPFDRMEGEFTYGSNNPWVWTHALGVPLWFPLFAIGMPTTFAWVGALRRVPPGACPKCRYDCTSLPAGARCPECGHSPSID